MENSYGLTMSVLATLCSDSDWEILCQKIVKILTYFQIRSDLLIYQELVLISSKMIRLLYSPYVMDLIHAL